MKVYNVNTDEYLESNEFNDIVDFIISVHDSREKDLAIKYPEYKVKPRVIVENPKGKDIFNHLKNYNTPFYDSVVCETILHKDNCGYIEINEFTYQLNCFSRTIFHRKKWLDYNNNGTDSFLYFVWDDWKKTQSDSEFDKLEAVADEHFEKCNNLLEYHKAFVYDDTHKFASVEEVREMFDQLVEQGLFLSKHGDLYKVYEDTAYEDAQTDSKDRWHSGKLSKFDEIHLRSSYKIQESKFKNLTSKLSFVPRVNTDNQFDGFWSQHKFGKRVFFIPQFLVFYNKVDK
jgi:hypothetical protein